MTFGGPFRYSALSGSSVETGSFSSHRMPIGGLDHALIRQTPDIVIQAPEFEPDPAAAPRLDLLHDSAPDAGQHQ